MNEELNKKLAEWAGFKNIRGRETLAQPTEVGSPRLWGLSKGIYHPIDFTQSLDACFKWLVPKIIESGDYSIIITQNLARCIGYVRDHCNLVGNMRLQTIGVQP